MVIRIERPAVPPTPYYYGLRAEWFRRESQRVLEKGDKALAESLYARAQHFQQLAQQLPFGNPNSEAV